MSDLYNSICLTQAAATFTRALGVSAPDSAAEPYSAVLEKLHAEFGDIGADRVFIYNPDAVALWIFQKYTKLFEPAMLRTQLQLPVLSVMPSVTPVCFASMYSGVMPSVHGIMRYEKPVLKIMTVFDVLSAAGKRCAIVSTEGDSISKIFLERSIDYYIYSTVDECNEKAMQLIDADEYDFITLYNGNYDSEMHRWSPEGDQSMAALKDNIEAFSAIYDAIKEKWSGHRTLLGFCPDHGCHEIDGGLGSHGLDMQEDMNIIHMFSFIK